MKFIELANLFEQLRSTKGNNDKAAIIGKFINEHDGAGLTFITNRPFIRKDSRVTKVADAAIKNIIKDAANTDEKTVVEAIKETGYFCTAAEKLMGGAKKQTSFLEPVELTVEQVEAVFSKLTEISGSGSNAARQKLIADTMRQMTPVEAKYFVAILCEQMPKGVGVGDGLSEQGIACATGTDSRLTSRVHNIKNDINVVLTIARKGDKALDAIDVTVFEPFWPMLAEGLKKGRTMKDVIKPGHKILADKKYDGFRLLIHLENGIVKLYSRQLEDKTDGFPEIVAAVKAAFPGVKKLIIDGECIGVSDEGRAIPFKKISTRIQKKDGSAATVKVKVKLFDILALEGHEYLFKLPYAERKALLASVLVPNDTFVPAECIITDDIMKVQEFFDLSREEGNEGLIIKELDGTYDFGDRHWIKAKGVLDTIDCVIYGAEWGYGKRQGVFGTFYIACLDGNGGYVPLGKCGNGFKDLKDKGGITLDEMTEMLRPLIMSDDGEVAMFNWAHAPVIEVASEEITFNADGGCAMRFPKFISLRTDKKADLYERVMTIFDGQSRHE